MGFELVTFIANNFCDILDAIKAGAPYDKNMIDCHIDALLAGQNGAVPPPDVPTRFRK